MTGEIAHDAEWDAGDTGCGDLVLELRARLRALAPGQVLLLRATDPGAPADIPAWCGLTKNPLRGAAPPHYWIARRATEPGPRGGGKSPH
jgi:tRNA 2-thiouridine synthesizing protein A